jgi:hypothetical protein
MPRTWLLRQGNANLRRDHIYAWTLPALTAQLPSGKNFVTCPAAGVCARLCFARTGSYRYANVRAAHLRNLLLTLEDLPGFEQQMTQEVQHRRYQGAHVRVHDAGDFYSDAYLQAWLRIAASAPGVSFYCYTKEIRRFLRLVEGGQAPPNFRWCYSLGGREDHLIPPGARIADVFPDEESITEAGYSSQAASDLLAVFGPPKVGMAANRIPELRKRQGNKTFGELQIERDLKRAPKRVRDAPDDDPALFGCA